MSLNDVECVQWRLFHQTPERTTLAGHDHQLEPLSKELPSLSFDFVFFSRQKIEELAQKVAVERTRREEESRRLEAEQAREREEQLRCQAEEQARREREEMERLRKQVGTWARGGSSGLQPLAWLSRWDLRPAEENWQRIVRITLSLIFCTFSICPFASASGHP